MEFILLSISQTEQNAALITLGCMAVVAVAAMLVSKIGNRKFIVSKTQLGIKVLSAIGLLSLLAYLPTLITHLFCVFWFLLFVLIFLAFIVIIFVVSII